jgi:hypothetical protein
MFIAMTQHAQYRLKGARQFGVTYKDVVETARKVPGKVTNFKWQGRTKDGKKFTLVISDVDRVRFVITIIGIRAQ